MSDYNTGDFWNEEDAAFWDEIGPIAVEIFHEAGASGAEALPAGLEILFDPSYYNEQAVDWLRKYKLEHISGIMETTRKNAVNIIDEWVQGGEHMDILTAKLDKLFGAPRGKSIAVTEVTRMYADGNTAAWENTGVVGEKRWNAAVDELVCPVCGEFHDTTRALDGGWFWLGGIVEGPPAHPNCRCYLTPVVSDELYERELERVLGERPGGEVTKKERVALENYANTDYRVVNPYLRDLPPDSSMSHLVHRRDETISLLDALIDKSSLERDTTVYRGLRTNIANNLDVGDIITDKGFVSTTTSRDKASLFATGGAETPTLFEVALPKNINAVDVDKLFDYANEAEILLGRSSSFEILEIRKEIFLRYGKEVELNVYVAKYLP